MATDGGLARFQRRMRAIPASARAAVAPVLVSAAEEAAEAMRALAPDDPATDAPDLKSSIAVTGPGQSTPPYSQPGGTMVVGELSAAVTAGNSEVRYPHLQEYGTSFHAAQPFFWPGFRLARQRVLARIKRGIAAAIREARAR